MNNLTRNQWVAVGIALVAAAIFVGYSYFQDFFNQFPINMNQQTNEESASTTPDQMATSSTAELGIKDVVVGTGETAMAGDMVTVNYTGTLVDGTKFDSSYDHGGPFPFVLGAGKVIAGWDIGVAGMKVGGKRDLVIPPSLGYGSNAVGPIPANSTLLFEVDLVSVQHPNQ